LLTALVPYQGNYLNCLSSILNWGGEAYTVTIGRTWLEMTRQGNPTWNRQ
jgi:hypothetical protein